MVSNHFIRWHDQQRSRRAPLARIDRPVRSHFYRGARAQAGIYGTRCTVYDIRYTFYTDCGRGGPEKASTRFSSVAPLALSSALARSLCTENGIHGRCVRATARRVPFFILQPSSTAAPFGRLLRVLEFRPRKRRSYSPAKRERITSQ